VSTAKTTICATCLSEKYVAKRISETDRPGECLYCHSQAPVLQLGELVGWIDEVLRQNYRPGDATPVFPEDDDNPSWETEGEPIKGILSEILETSDYIASDLFDLLSGSEYDEVRDGGQPFYDRYSNYKLREVDATYS
jgi:hypothetical protein